MRSILLALTTLFLVAGVNGQVLQPAEWEVSTSKEKVAQGEQLDVVFEVSIHPDWYLYSSDFDPDCGPMVTTFDFQENNSYRLVGDVKPIDPNKKFDEIFECDYTYFKDKAKFVQTIEVLQAPLTISGFYEYQVCSDIDGKCIPFDDEFKITSVKVVASDTRDEPLKKEPPGQSEALTKSEDKNKKAASVETKSLENEPVAKDETSKPDSVSDTQMLPEKEEQEESADAITDQGKNKAVAASLNARDSNDPYSLLAFMAIAFLAGLAAILTPCVFPMIPVTVTFFTSGSSNKKQGILKGLMYGLSIIAIYTIIGVLVSMIFGAEVANDLATSATANLIFFFVFVFFGLSFLGMFEITLPSSWVNNVDKQADKGGLMGIIFMAFTLVLVSFSCTGPIVGSILVESAGGQFLKPTLGMFAFSLAFAIPFTLFAIFPDWIANLPKSGGWLNSVKVVLGFIELALALKFLSIADQVYHWGILDREVFLAIWIVILTFLGFYFLGKIRLPHDSKIKTISIPRILLAIATFSFVVYLIPGMVGAPLKAMAGYLPPMTTHDFDLITLIRENKGGGVLASDTKKICDDPKYDEFLKFPHGIKGYFDYEQAIACARKQNKPLFIDFTGHGCVNCREMEARVWSDPAVLERLKNDFVMLALYVDDKKTLAEEEWYTSSYDGKVKKTIGKQNADFQISRFNNNAQPFYVILDNEENLLVEPKAYDLNVESFVAFLDKAKSRFENKQTLVSEKNR